MGENPLRLILDAEAIYFEGAWLKKEDLAGQITRRLEAGDFSVAHLSSALEQLVSSVRDARVVAFRVPPQLAEALAAQSQQSGLPVGALLRHALATMLLQQPTHGAVTEPASAEDGANAVTLRPKGGAAPEANPSGAEQTWFANQQHSR